MSEIERARRALARFRELYAMPGVPVDVEEVAGSLFGLRVRMAADLSAAAPQPSAAANLSGLLLPERREIWVRRDEPHPRRRFTIAHEVGHWVLHAEVGRVYCRSTDLELPPDDRDHEIEREANRFAAELLMPEADVRAAVDRLGPDPGLLAQLFRAHPVAMGYRLVNLGYLAELPVDLERVRQEWSAG
ncbi:MAG: hypothetical protein QOG33_2155 [Gaiellales bacterium]|jgi:hypothetical protein|nr:hypothetical protein [Gaiellales bacterium]